LEKYTLEFEKEYTYLETTLNVLKRELQRAIETSNFRKVNLINVRKQMWENSSHSSLDFDKLIETNQYLSEVNNQTTAYENVLALSKKYQQMLDSPYFGRFDFVEDGFDNPEKIYMGIHNLTDPNTHIILVHDWRAPICSIFYQFEPGNAWYMCPNGKISGKVILKRQYKIKNSKLEYFFDCSVPINDSILQQALSQNTSPKMRTIVETIQKEQDTIIRNTDSHLVIVQGVAGSGKTSVALHRTAFLVYKELESAIKHKDILIISPNRIFSNYISNVLPDLGEKNVEQIIFDEFAASALEQKFHIHKRNEMIESLLRSRSSWQTLLKKSALQFKGSATFTHMLDKLVHYFIKHILNFQDVYYNGKTLITRQYLKNMLLNSKLNLPLAKKLEKMESFILDKLHAKRKNRLAKLQKFVEQFPIHQFEVKQVARLLSLKESKAVLNSIYKYTRVNFYDIYCLLFLNPDIFKHISNGLVLPDNINDIIMDTAKAIKNGQILYEDLSAILYLKYKIEGCQEFENIKHVIIDEGQDYSVLQYNIFKMIFKNADFTILSDINQSIELSVNKSLYNDIIDILAKKNPIKIFLNKSYRTSFEIFSLSQHVLGKKTNSVVFKRHEDDPFIVCLNTTQEIDMEIISQVNCLFDKGYESIAILCKTAAESKELHDRLSNKLDISLMIDNTSLLTHGTIIMPIYMSKGLEFDAVIIYNVSDSNFSTGLDQRLLYIACTRALHKLVLCALGDKSSFITQ